jgi:hypothetical protein
VIYDPLHPDSDTPKNGDFATYVDSLVHRDGQSAPGSGAPRPSTPAPGPAKPAARSTSEGHPVGDGQQPGASGPVVIGKLSNLLLSLGGVWVVLGLLIGVPFFASSLPVGLILIFASFFIRQRFRS